MGVLGWVVSDVNCLQKRPARAPGSGHLVGPAPSLSVFQQRRGQVLPGWIQGLDQFQLPGSGPSLQRFLSLNGSCHRRVPLVPHEYGCAVASAEALRFAVPVLVEPGQQIGRDPDVEGGVGAAAQDVHTGFSHWRGCEHGGCLS